MIYSLKFLDSEDEVRVVKSQKDRAFGAMRERVNKIYNLKKNNDWPAIQDEFNEVNRMIDASKMLIMLHGMPKFYIKMLADVEDHLKATLSDKEGLKKMKQTVSHAVDRMKLVVRKHNKKFETEINDFKLHPEKYEESDQEEEESDDESDDDDDDEDDEDYAPKAPLKKKITKKAVRKI